jgi:FHS family L-fucose permease-like MFS transporter
MPPTILNTPQEREGLRLTLVVTVGLLAIWGMAFWLFNALFFKFTHFFALKPVAIALTYGGLHLAYVLIAIPALLFHRKFGFKLGILAGLSVFGVACFLLFLAMVQQETLYFLGAVTVIGACVAWLDSSLNPLAVMAGRPQTAVKRLNFAHAFYGIGLFAGYYTAVFVLGPDYLLSKVTAAEAVRPYVLVGLGAILLAFVVEQITLPRFASTGCGKSSAWRDDVGWLLQDRRFRISAMALAAYSVVLSLLWTANYRYNVHEMSSHLITVFERGSFWFALGRICGVVLMRWLEPMLILRASSALCLLAIAVSAATGGSLRPSSRSRSNTCVGLPLSHKT